MKIEKLFKKLVLINALIIFSHFSNAELSVGVEWTDYYPIYATQDNRYKGFARELLDEFAKDVNQKVNYYPMSVRRITTDYLAGNFDFKFPDNAAWASDLKKGHDIAYSAPVLSYIDGVMVLARNLGKGKEHLKTIGYLHGFTPFTYLNEIQSREIDTRKTGSMKHLFKMLKTGRIDGAYINITVAEYFLRNSDYGSNLAKFDNGLPHSVGEYHLSSFKQPTMIAEFNSFLQKKSKLIDKLERKYELK